MKYFVSYFYQVRNFPNNVLPISTAKWDPKWFHEFQSQNHLFLDKRGIVNGARAPQLVFPEENFLALEEQGQACRKDCPFYGTDCQFMKVYFEYLSTIDFNSFLDKLERYAAQVSNLTHIPLDTIVLLVHEPPTVTCAERPVLQKWFSANGMNLSEWTKPQ